MEAYQRKDEGCPKLLDLISEERQWIVKMEQETSHGGSVEKKLELRLGPPGEDESSLLSFGCFANSTNSGSGTKRGFTDSTVNGNQAQKFSFSEDHHVFSTPWSSSAYHGKGQQLQQQTRASFLQLQSTSSQCLPAVMSKESSQHCCTKAVDLQSAEKKAFSPPCANTAVPNSTAQKRYLSFLLFSSLLYVLFLFWTQDIHFFTYMI